MLVQYIEEQEAKSNLILSLISEPFYVDSRRGAREKNVKIKFLITKIDAKARVIAKTI